MGERIDARWLSIRREADTAAREASLSLVQMLAAHFGTTQISSDELDVDELDVIDIGAGTGANAQWLAPRLHQSLRAVGAFAAQHWHLLDHDPALLKARSLALPGKQVRVSDHLATTADLAAVLRGIEGVSLVTCSALLDLLSSAEIDALAADTVAGADAALLALSVTGVITITPGDCADALVSDLFNLHQQRAELEDAGAPAQAAAGPTGWRHAQAAFEGAGWSVDTAHTPWLLGPHQAPLSRRLLVERAEAAAQMASDASGRADVRAWLARRERHLETSGLDIRVDHIDMLALPPRSISVQMSSPRA
ncbi:MAG: hypothetical protein WBG57_05970 [Ornithinimicrobium sp.]